MSQTVTASLSSCQEKSDFTVLIRRHTLAFTSGLVILNAPALRNYITTGTRNVAQMVAPTHKNPGPLNSGKNQESAAWDVQQKYRLSSDRNALNQKQIIFIQVLSWFPHQRVLNPKHYVPCGNPSVYSFRQTDAHSCPENSQVFSGSCAKSPTLSTS